MGNSGSTIAGTQNPADKKVTSSGSCPVDEGARKAWLEAARNNPTLAKQHPVSPVISDLQSNDEQNQRLETKHRQAKRVITDDLSKAPRFPQQPVARQHEVSYEDRAKQNDGAQEQSTGNRPLSSKINDSLDKSPHLGTQRVISSIPRADMAPATTTPDPRSMPSSEGAEEKAGNWIYPSEKMFFDAMKRKSFSPDQKDMPAIVPIHNAVNERAWSMIKTWESSSARLKALNAPCGGPKLRSFSGDAAKLSPKARVLGWVGYQAPFDRHDWVVERCEGGGSVEYVIDFYKGRGDGLAFYLDVRPKLNTWEGCRMRMGSWVGLT
ncbi:MAG: hypothetical protein L6R38_000384 [Xanthoria sp. 2 TBL-2021]|nr:MAG: hypothetical protein L6R38_000384 [Xanthoria sp. 2 TBL-2021]